MATRKEHALALSSAKKRKFRERIENLVCGVFAGNYKHKDGQFNISMIAKELNTNRTLVKKHLRELGLHTQNLSFFRTKAEKI